jgi:anti-anti-sigma factor
MALDITTVITEQVAEVTLLGELDRASAPRLHQELMGVVARKPGRLVLRLRELVYLASAGVRVLLMIMQTSPGLSVYVIAPQKQVRQVIDDSGLLRGIIIEDEDPGAG